MWDQRYSEEGYAYGVEPNDFLKETIPTLELPSHARCLLLAEGEGRNAVWMAGLGMDVTAVDNSKVGLDKALKLANEKGLSIATHVADLAEYNLGENQWDCIVGISCHIPPPIRKRIFSMIPIALKAGGYFVLEAYTPAQLEFKTGGPSVADLMYSSAILSQALEGQLEIQKNDEVIRQVVEGKYHTGEAAVVQFVGRCQKTAT